MSYEIIKSISIKDGKVFIVGASNNVSPRHFYSFECTALTNILQTKGQDALDLAILKDYEGGNFQRGSNKWTRALERLRNMPEYRLYDWTGNDMDAYREVCKRRETPDFEALLLRALKDKFPKEKYIVAKPYGFYTVYLHTCSQKRAIFTYDKSRAKTFHYKRDAEILSRSYTNGNEWDVIAA